MDGLTDGLVVELTGDAAEVDGAGYAQRPHVLSADCWCRPVVDEVAGRRFVRPWGVVTAAHLRPGERAVARNYVTGEIVDVVGEVADGERE